MSSFEIDAAGKQGHSANQDYKELIGLVWDIYDSDASGALDKDECKKLVTFILEKVLDTKIADGCFQSQFDKTFDEYDLDENGRIDKHEMIDLMNRLLGGTYDVKRGKCRWFTHLLSNLC